MMTGMGTLPRADVRTNTPVACASSHDVLLRDGLGAYWARIEAYAPHPGDVPGQARLKGEAT
jgi:hypothetical protein